MKKQNPQDQASLISLVFFSWLLGLVRLGNQRPLKEDDLFELSDRNKAEVIVENFEKTWSNEIYHAKTNSRNGRLWKAMLRSIAAKDYLFIIAMSLLESLTSCSLVLLLWVYQKLSMEGSKTSSHVLAIVMGGIAISNLLQVFAVNHNCCNNLLIGMRLKIACVGNVYKKILASIRSSLSKATVGHIINLASSDAERMERLVFCIQFCLIFFIDFFVTIVLLTVLVGWQSLSGAFVIIQVSFLIMFASKQFGKLRIKQASVTDKRLSTVSDIITGIRAVKMFAWEWKYQDKITKLRRKEMNFVRRKSLILVLPVVLVFALPLVATLTSTVTVLYSGIHLNAVNIFIIVSILNNFNKSMNLFNVGANGVSDALASMSRIEKYLTIYNTCTTFRNADQLPLMNKIMKAFSNCFQNNQQYSSTISKVKYTLLSNGEEPLQTSILNDDDFEQTVRLSHVYSGWFEDANECKLHDISLEATSNQLVMVTGPVGSGKSTLLMTILHEIPIKSGKCFTRGKIAYASQIPWIFTGTVRENILFGKKFEEKRYQKILNSCDLLKDISQFPKADMSMTGQRGVCLSGGQRARVCLARVVYSDADIFLLDDLLSAVDAKVSLQIFHKSICEELSGKIRILVTHQLQHLHRADIIVVLKEGRVVDLGSYAHISKDTTVSKMLADYQTTDIQIFSADQKGTLSSKEDLDVHMSSDMIEEDEDRISGTVSWRLYWYYFRVGLPAWLVVCLFIFFLIAQGAIVIPTWWLKKIANMPYSKQKSAFNIGVYGAMVGGSAILVAARVIFMFYTFLRSSEILHNKMALAVIKSPVLFFDTNPVGRIMNRFSKDIDALDDKIPRDFVTALSFFCLFLGVLALTVIMNAWFFLAVVPTVIAVTVFSRFYFKVACQLSRLESIRCSPVYDHIAETISGLEVIHLLKMEGSFLEKYCKKQNMHTRAFSLVFFAERWFGLHVDILCGIFLTGLGFGTFILSLDAATTGLLISSAISITRLTSVSLRFASLVESQMTSVERIKTYTKLPSEPGYDRQAKIPKKWPDKGSLSLRGISLMYLEGGPTILKDINFDVQPLEKVGITGRTGAGKSSLVAALFRMPDPQGQVLVDGVDLSTINIQEARRSIAVITQQPMLFEGSLKKNLDPFSCFEEEEIWTALKEVQLDERVKKLDGLLEYAFGERGSGFSAGENQLFCLARALLQRRKILVLDEATANVDYKTDQLIQQVIRDKFSNCTVLTIAHRLNTIIDYDRVVVLDQGRVIENDSPSVLASKRDGIFASLLRDHSHSSTM